MTLQTHQLTRLQKMIFFCCQEEKTCHPEKHGELLQKKHQLTRLIFKFKL